MAKAGLRSVASQNDTDDSPNDVQITKPTVTAPIA